MLGWGEESGVIVSDQFSGVVTFVDGIKERLHDYALVGGVICFWSVGDHIVSFTLGSEWNSPEVTTFVSPPSEDNLTVELNFDSMFREEDITTGIAECGNCQEIVCNSWAPVCHPCCRW